MKFEINFKNSAWGEWSAWTGCDVTCGGGANIRSRICENGDVGDVGCDVGDATQTDVCESQHCPGLRNLKKINL